MENKHSKYNRYTLLVLEELKGDLYFNKENSLILYKIPREQEQLDSETLAGKIQAVWNLRDLGAIKIHEEERVSNTVNYEFHILIVHSAFDKIYERCIKEVLGRSLEEYEQQAQNKKNLPAIRQKLQEIIFTRKLGKKQAKLLNLLADFQHKKTSRLKSEIVTKDLKSLVSDTNSRLKGTGLSVKSVKSNSSLSDNFYQLHYFPPTLKT